MGMMVCLLIAAMLGRRSCLYIHVSKTLAHVEAYLTHAMFTCTIPGEIREAIFRMSVGMQCNLNKVACASAGIFASGNYFNLQREGGTVV